MRRLLALAVLGLAIGAGAALAFRALVARRPPLPDPPAVAVKLREVARLETLDVTLYKKVTFEPDPEPAGSFWGDVSGWARYAFRSPRGKAIVFADAHLGLDLAKLDASRVRVSGREVFVVLPLVVASVELRPGDTEVVGSNLDSAETAKLFELAKEAFRREVEADRGLSERARGSAERALRGLLLEAGFERVTFGAALPAVPAS